MEILTGREVKILKDFIYKKGYETIKGYSQGIETRTLKKQSEELQEIFSKLNDSNYSIKNKIKLYYEGV